MASLYEASTVMYVNPAIAFVVQPRASSEPHKSSVSK